MRGFPKAAALAATVLGGSAQAATLVHSYELGGPALGVPEPAAWAMMLGGFGLLGAATRRRRTLATVTA